MRKSIIFLIPILLLLLIGVFFLKQDPLPGWEPPEELPKNYQHQIQQEILQVFSLLEHTSASIDEQETVLIEAGLPVLDTDEIYPTYLANPEKLTAFWASVSDEKDSSVSVLRVLDDQSFRHIFFLYEKGHALFFTADITANARNELSVADSSVLPVYDMELTDWGIFYYRVYPAGDPHYIDYGEIRLQSADRELYDLNRTYILPVGYQMVNLFLTDWQESSWQRLSFHDLLEALHARQTGDALLWEHYPWEGGSSRIRIPADIFEGAILPCFQISLEEFRSICQYDAISDSYPWRPVHGNDLTTWHYPMCEPEVMGFTENSDGTITLDVQVYSPDLKTDRLFCHQLTVRPLDGENFQYVANKVTYVSDRGLPPNMPRFELDEA